MNRYEWLDAYLQSKAGATKDYKLEWGWWRYQVGGKLFAATCRPGAEHKGYDCRELVTLKCEPLLADALWAEYPDVIPGFYMDKRNWISVYLDGSLPDDVMRDLCDRSYALVFGKLTQKLRRAIEAEGPAGDISLPSGGEE
ncbi:MAG: MmcQ/YjbR family DNA-binding protein [Bacillota bacterium]